MQATGTSGMGRGEFVALIAMLFSTIAFSVDSLLAAFPQIEADLNAPGRAHLLLTVFMGGLALGTLVAGPISDALGRKTTIYIGALLYISAGVVAWLSSSFELMVAARLVQGMGAAGPRVVGMAIVRDLYSGRYMAQIVSFAMLLFTIVPTVAPAMGAVLNDLFGWRSILLAFILFSFISTTWLWLRLPESLPPAARVPLNMYRLSRSLVEIVAHPVVRLAILAQSVALGIIFCLLVQVQPIYDQVFGRVETFPYWFGGVALFSAASTSVTNAWLVVRVGMLLLVSLGMLGQVVFAAFAFIASILMPEWAFGFFILWQFMAIFLSGLCIGNLNAVAMEPMGHIAGFTASVTGAVSTLLAAAAATFLGLMFDGTQYPLLMTCCVLAMLGVILARAMRLVTTRLQDESPAPPVFRSSRR